MKTGALPSVWTEYRVLPWAIIYTLVNACLNLCVNETETESIKVLQSCVYKDES